VANSWWKQQVKKDQLLTEPLLVATLDYRTVEQTDVQGSGSFRVSRSGTAHGVSVWFDSELSEGAAFSNAPGQPELIYGNAFFPLERPMEIAPADTVDLTYGASLTGRDYVWRWNTRIARDGALRAEYRQSTALGFPLSPALLERSSERFVPTLDEGGDALRFVLASMSGDLSVREIAAQTAERFPRLFPRDGDSLQYVIRLAQKHSRQRP
jgi:protein arginine N-methyltransferase 1